MTDNNFETYEERVEREEKEKKAAEEAEKRLDTALLSVLGTKSGREALAWMLSLTAQDVSVTAFDALRMAWQSGRRDVGLDILTRLRALSPELVRLMEQERDDRRNTRLDVDGAGK
ncbi:hypothetical protein [Sutterella sp.]|uniref:hypothetical protein n=1 Tax=Sutterella sp. TaxID=1981025 RepID=UPI0026DF10F6|nr:hypothetical protein [Sutterella sp.]MDO5531059.1 hypothetical protein [Sutterella sp.]